jgi:hypothetical protein
MNLTIRMTPLVFGSTERVVAAIDPPETSWVRFRDCTGEPSKRLWQTVFVQ